MRFRASQSGGSGVAGEAGAVVELGGSRLAPVPARRGERSVLLASADGVAETSALRLRPGERRGRGRRRLAIREFMISEFRHTRPNHALQRTRPCRSRCNPGSWWAGSLSLGR